MINPKILRKAFDFYLKADTRYQVHSPFVASFIEEVLRNKRNYYAFDRIDSIFRLLLRDTTAIEHHDLGAGSQNKNKIKTIKQIAKTASSTEKKGKILFNLARNYKAQTILELGSNLGIGTSYLASANTNSVVKSIEGCPNLAQYARKTLAQAKVKNTEIVQGAFEEKLEKTLQSLEKIDLAFVDGNHSYEATLKYFRIIKPYLNDNSILVFDDIHWSEGMIKAWNEIKGMNLHQLSVDNFYFGILFFGPKLPDGELKLIPYRYKPWKMGFFR